MNNEHIKDVKSVQERINQEKFQGAINAPSLSIHQDITNDELLEELTQDYDAHQGQPSLNVINPSEAYGAIQEVEDLPQLPSLPVREDGRW